MKWRLKATIALAIIAASTVGPAAAQSFPTKPVKLIAPFAPGGVADVMARIVGDNYRNHWAYRSS